MTIEKQKEFNDKLLGLCKEYNVSLQPQLNISIVDLPEVVEPKAEEVKKEVK